MKAKLIVLSGFTVTEPKKVAIWIPDKGNMVIYDYLNLAPPNVWIDTNPNDWSYRCERVLDEDYEIDDEIVEQLYEMQSLILSLSSKEHPAKQLLNGLKEKYKGEKEFSF